MLSFFPLLLGCGEALVELSAASLRVGEPSQVSGRPLRPPRLVPQLSGLHTDSGAVLWALSSDHLLNLQVDKGEGWQDAEIAPMQAEELRLWWVPEGPSDALWRLRAEGGVSEAISTAPIDLTLTGPPAESLILNGESVPLSLAGSLPEGLPLSVSFSLIDGAQEQPLDARCLVDGGSLQDCLVTGDGLQVMETQGLSLEAGEGERVGFSPALWMDAPTELVVQASLALDGGPVLDTAAVSFIALGRAVAWGDLHAHSNLSHDGCEEPDEDCNQTGDVPGEEFFTHAVDNGLDFAAMTDHAEWDYHVPAGDEEAMEYVWEAQQERIAEAEGVVALLGYEWTLDDDSRGHKTVILEAETACSAWRVRAPRSEESRAKSYGGDYHTGLNAVSADDFIALWQALEAAEEECGGERYFTFSHHTAWSIPRSTDWDEESNAPDPSHETVIEMYSEHGSSECVDMAAEGCQWGLKTDGSYVASGSVQAALQQGYRLGFVGGTDSHNANPGSIEDEPSCTGNWADSDGDGVPDTLKCHDHPGALTGAYYTGDFERGDLFDAIAARQTMVTSGPRLPARALVVDEEGNLHLPGAVLPEGDIRLRLALTADDLDGMEVIDISAVYPDNSTAAWTDTLPLDVELTVVPGDVLYLRVRLDDGQNEQRVWFSPWFVE